LYAQLEVRDTIQTKWQLLWNRYFDGLMRWASDFSMLGAVAESDRTLEKSQIIGVFKRSKESWPLAL